MLAAKNKQKRTKGFTTAELLIVLGIIGLLFGGLVGAMSLNNIIQVNRAKADIVKLKVLLQMYHEDTGTYPTGGIIGMIRGLSFPDCGWSEACLRDYVVDPQTFSVPLDANNHRIYKSHAVEGDPNAYNVQTYTNPVTGKTFLGALAFEEEKDLDGDGVKEKRVVMTMIDPWGNEYVYLSSMEYASPPGPTDPSAMVTTNDFARNPAVGTGQAAQAASYGFSEGDSDSYYGGDDGYQIYSFGPDRIKALPSDREASKDNINSWSIK